MSFLPNVECIVSPPFQENTYIVWLDGRSDCVIVDPGTTPDDVIELLEERGLTPAAILLTHGHSDHIAGNAALKERWPDCPLVIGELDAVKLIDPVQNLSAQYGFHLVSPPADVLVHEGESYSAAGMDFEIHETPGHSIGHVIFVWKSTDTTVVFGGDVLFAGGVGRTDFPDGSFQQLAQSIRNHFYNLPDEAVVLSGHGPATTVGREKKSNPFVRPA